MALLSYPDPRDSRELIRAILVLLSGMVLLSCAAGPQGRRDRELRLQALEAKKLQDYERLARELTSSRARLTLTAKSTELCIGSSILTTTTLTNISSEPLQVAVDGVWDTMHVVYLRQEWRPESDPWIWNWCLDCRSSPLVLAPGESFSFEDELDMNRQRYDGYYTRPGRYLMYVNYAVRPLDMVFGPGPKLTERFMSNILVFELKECPKSR